MILFVCVVVMYSGEYDVCDVTLSVHPHGKLKSLLDHGGNRTRDLWDTSLKSRIALQVARKVAPCNMALTATNWIKLKSSTYSMFSRVKFCKRLHSFCTLWKAPVK